MGFPLPLPLPLTLTPNPNPNFHANPNSHPNPDQVKVAERLGSFKGGADDVLGHSWFEGLDT